VSHESNLKFFKLPELLKMVKSDSDLGFCRRPPRCRRQGGAPGGGPARAESHPDSESDRPEPEAGPGGPERVVARSNFELERQLYTFKDANRCHWQ